MGEGDARRSPEVHLKLDVSGRLLTLLGLVGERHPLLKLSSLENFCEVDLCGADEIVRSNILVITGNRHGFAVEDIEGELRQPFRGQGPVDSLGLLRNRDLLSAGGRGLLGILDDLLDILGLHVGVGHGVDRGGLALIDGDFQVRVWLPPAVRVAEGLGRVHDDAELAEGEEGELAAESATRLGLFFVGHCERGDVGSATAHHVEKVHHTLSDEIVLAKIVVEHLDFAALGPVLLVDHDEELLAVEVGGRAAVAVRLGLSVGLSHGEVYVRVLGVHHVPLVGQVDTLVADEPDGAVAGCPELDLDGELAAILGGSRLVHVHLQHLRAVSKVVGAGEGVRDVQLGGADALVAQKIIVEEVDLEEHRAVLVLD
mmetsp:Transcript_13428/g.24696  ORF Transcript_13428/g.24696 Transcript_13428/m.24696 type:complete len:371 (-) Transcript_13428:1297-2409(-)